MNATEKARYFLEHERAFRLGMLPTECSHPKTVSLSSTIAKNTADGIGMLLQVDEDVPPAMTRVFASPAFASLTSAFVEAIAAGKKVFFVGCGATGRLAILLEAAWREFWQELFVAHPELRERLPNPVESLVSVMAGGDYALIHSVEGFEDSTDLGRHQLSEAGVTAGDVVVAITEGGETSFVIGGAWQGLDAGANVFFVYNNPTDILRQYIVRSRELIEEPRVVKLDLFTGPMAIAGSTRMQATTAELLAVGGALELALVALLRRWLPPETLRQIGVPSRQKEEYPLLFAALIREFQMLANLKTLAELVEWEESLYRNKGLVTYMTDRFLLDVLTDTTERAPTFRLPPFRTCDDATSARSWAFVKNPRYGTRESWWHVLRREPRGIAWPTSVYQTLDVSEELRKNPPRLDNAEIWKFMIGNELDPSRSSAPDSGLAAISVGGEIQESGAAREAFDRMFDIHAASFQRTASIVVGPARLDRNVEKQFHVAVSLPASPLRLWERLAAKLTFNLMSTSVMARMGRVEGNYMSRVETSNKKLIDRANRLVAHLACVDYETACYAVFDAMERVSAQEKATKDAPSPVSVAVESLRNGRQSSVNEAQTIGNSNGHNSNGHGTPLASSNCTAN